MSKKLIIKTEYPLSEKQKEETIKKYTESLKKYGMIIVDDSVKDVEVIEFDCNEVGLC